jgi:hypothetical protein
VIDEDQYTPEVVYGAGNYTFTREKIGTRYVTLGVRILVDPADPEDMKQVHALQDAIAVTQPGGPGRFEVPNWDQVSRKKVHDALLALAETLPDTKVRSEPETRSIPFDTGLGPRSPLAAIPRKMPFILMSPRARTTGRRSTGSPSRTFRLTPSGQSASTTQRGTSRRTRSMHIR